MGYSFRLTARVLLYAPSHRQDSTYHSLCYTSRGALAGTRNSSMGPPHEGSIRRPIAPWANALITELRLAPLGGVNYWTFKESRLNTYYCFKNRSWHIFFYIWERVGGRGASSWHCLGRKIVLSVIYHTLVMLTNFSTLESSLHQLVCEQVHCREASGEWLKHIIYTVNHKSKNTYNLHVFMHLNYS